MSRPVWGKDGLDHRYCDSETCCADGTYRSDPSCPKCTGGRKHDCGYA